MEEVNAPETKGSGLPFDSRYPLQATPIKMRGIDAVAGLLCEAGDSSLVHSGISPDAIRRGGSGYPVSDTE